MYQADIEFGMKQHPWRKVLDQCFVTRRDVYRECGGLREELGHFAEWVLAAAYHARGYSIGYLEEARFHHYYVGELDELKQFTLDFVQGEIRYLSEARNDAGSELLDIPVEWSARSEAGTSLARNALNALLRYSLAGGGWGRPGESLGVMALGRAGAARRSRRARFRAAGGMARAGRAGRSDGRRIERGDRAMDAAIHRRADPASETRLHSSSRARCAVCWRPSW